MKRKRERLAPGRTESWYGSWAVSLLADSYDVFEKDRDLFTDKDRRELRDEINKFFSEWMPIRKGGKMLMVVDDE